MRIISGKWSGIRLESVEAPYLRPMLDRVKESLFNILQARIEGRVALDLFSGTGSLGIEALSRGARLCCFVEKKTEFIRIIQQNLEKCRIWDEAAEIIKTDYHALPEMGCPLERNAELVFADPPYAMIADSETREKFFRTLEGMLEQWIAPGALMVLHHEPDPDIKWPDGCVRLLDKRIYGRSQLTFFKITKIGKAGDGG